VVLKAFLVFREHKVQLGRKDFKELPEQLVQQGLRGSRVNKDSPVREGLKVL